MNWRIFLMARYDTVAFTNNLSALCYKMLRVEVGIDEAWNHTINIHSNQN